MHASSDNKRLIGLVRVSTDRQGESGLGLDAQLAAIERFRAGNGSEVVETYREIESGKHNDIKRRPRLQEAVDHALELDATLVIAKLDRLVRSTSVMHYLKSSGVKFVACDNPYANEMTIDILVAVAAGEARMISTRTREALGAYKAGRRVSRRVRQMYPDGVPADVVEATAGKLGSHLPQCRHNLTDEARAKGRAIQAAARRERAERSAEAIGRILREILQAEPDLSLAQLADRLNARGRRTPNGHPWAKGMVKRVLDRMRSRG